jgi:hypothetical protein
MKRFWIMTGIAAIAMTVCRESAAVEHRLGAGGHYWAVVDDIEVDNIDEQGIAWFLSYQLRPAGLVALEVDFEFLPDDFAGAAEPVYAPQAYVLVGGAIYAGVGIGSYYSDGRFAKDPFYALKAGLDLEVLPSVHLDISGNYRFTEWDDSVTEDIGTDTVTIAVAARVAL